VELFLERDAELIEMCDVIGFRFLMMTGVNVCVLTCPPEGEAVSNTRAYQSPLDVPPPPRNLTTRIKARLGVTPIQPIV
jgi:hypothetical protein